MYTRWLKRTTPQNIVIGGAAGAIPPLVGYAAVRGTLDLTAWILFLIIFYWTPPHFWALALLKQRDYGEAGVPMAPLVWGEEHTANQMLWYTGIMVALTVLPFCFGAFGMFYLVCALVVAAPLVYGVVQVNGRGRPCGCRRGSYSNIRCCISHCCISRWRSICTCSADGGSRQL